MRSSISRGLGAALAVAAKHAAAFADAVGNVRGNDGATRTRQRTAYGRSDLYVPYERAPSSTNGGKRAGHSVRANQRASVKRRNQVRNRRAHR